MIFLLNYPEGSFKFNSYVYTFASLNSSSSDSISYVPCCCYFDFVLSKSECDNCSGTLKGTAPLEDPLRIIRKYL